MKIMPKTALRDVAAGLIIALVSIPISMGYAQVAGLPAVYGLYGSVLPILIFGLLSTSPRFVFGVDAAPAALVGMLLSEMGIVQGSAEALRVVPVVTLVTAVWILLFRLIGAGRFVRFISEPVMGGFISGIGCTIIMIQVPKLYGGSSGIGEAPALIRHIAETALEGVHPLSLAMGLITIAVILIGRRLCPKVPMSVIMMGLGALVTVLWHPERCGVALLSAVEPGLPSLVLPDIRILAGHGPAIIVSSLTIALVIVSETLLATTSYALKYGDKIDNNREILAYGLGNLSAALTGTCPVNGSVSRTGIADQFGVTSQLMSVSAAGFMVLVLLFMTGFIAYLPVPVLTGIVISALIGILEFRLAGRLRKVDRMEWVIFWAAFLVVLLFGTIYGVMAGVILSFFTVVVRASEPPREFLGYHASDNSFYPLSAHGTLPLSGTVIYRLTGPLFFANIDILDKDIKQAVREETKRVIIEASGVPSVDVTAAERLLSLYRHLRGRGISLMIAGHRASVNEQLRTFGAGELITEEAVKMSLPQALADSGARRPYALEAPAEESSSDSAGADVGHTRLYEAFSWAYGPEEAGRRVLELAAKVAADSLARQSVDMALLDREEEKLAGSYWNAVDEDEFLSEVVRQQLLGLEEDLKGPGTDREKLKKLADRLIRRQIDVEEKLDKRHDEDALRHIVERRHREDDYLREHHPEAYRELSAVRRYYMSVMEERSPELAAHIKKMWEEL